MFGKKTGKQKIYISAINGLPFPPNLLKTGVGPSVVQSCHSSSLLFGGKKENRKICISIINGPSLPPKPSQTVKPPPNCHKFYSQKSPWQECVSVNRSSYYRPPHLHCQTEFGTNLTPLNRLQSYMSTPSDAHLYNLLEKSIKSIRNP